ncbi:hypothetical protein ACOT81_34370 [Streptomyces sp. WI04-05B]|uniref:hypothetical protein n=1 Tax=Streptomyces TaxID=1883 RepID=UPI0029B0BA27|nr:MULTISPECIES: hypothetical protein [unclassified Streptomyces]MDX2541949.1 hypothetical protein [Streptomyces sp. WI04-05B]MDX2587031.1 hypothetical protein [Streptomyces sp. WI04-05A]MDX3749998.1 hypothetical protein [Streptomyces sp. AK08-02]
MWGRSRARRQRQVEGLAAVAGPVEAADAAQQALLELRRTLRGELTRIEALLDKGDGLPSDTIREQTLGAVGVFADLDGVLRHYDEIRTGTVAAAENGVEAAGPWLAALGEHTRSMTELGETFAGFGESFAYLRERTERLRTDLAPLREGVHAALRAAQGELTAAEGADGWPGWQAGLTALGDRLTELDAGRVTPTARQKVSDRYRELEREVEQLRGAMAAAPR